MMQVGQPTRAFIPVQQTGTNVTARNLQLCCEEHRASRFQSGEFAKGAPGAFPAFRLGRVTANA